MKTIIQHAYRKSMQAVKEHIKLHANKRRDLIHEAVSQHLPIQNENVFPLADMVTDYYEPTYEQMEQAE